MKTWSVWAVVLGVWLAMWGQVVAQAPVVSSFTQNGQLTATNIVPGSTAIVEWASSLNGPWQTNWTGLDAVTVAPDGSITVNVPLFYRVRGLPRVPPSVTTGNATAVTSSSANLPATGNPNGSTTTGWFRYTTVNPGTPSDSAGTRAPSSGGSGLGNGTTDVGFAQSLTGLLPGTTYYYWAVAQSAEGMVFGEVKTFTASVSAPTVTVGAPSNRTGTTATLNATVNPGGANAGGWFRYNTVSPGVANDSSGIRVPASGAVAVGSGTSSVGMAQNITGLAPGTTYFVWAIATNSAGTALSSITSFTTPTAPAVTTTAATGVANTWVTMNGSGNPNGASTTGWFRYATSDPGVANDSAGIRVPASGGSALGSGVGAVNFSQSVTGLTAGAVYYYWTIAQNAEGTAFGSIRTWTNTVTPPSASTGSATDRTSTSATLNASINPNGVATVAWFRYATNSPGVGNDTAGTRAPAGSPLSAGSATSATGVSQGITGLTPGTTYFYWVVASNNLGRTFGTVTLFTTPSAPAAVTQPASAITGAAATLNATGNPNGASATGWFRYSTTDPGVANDTSGIRAPTSGGSNLGAGTSPTAYAQNITGLVQGTRYYYWPIVSSAEGTAFGAVSSFLTPQAPSVATSNATSVTSSSATLVGGANPNGASATGWFRLSASNPGTPSDSFGVRVPASSVADNVLGSGTNVVGYTQVITSLLPGTTYYYCAIANNTEGTGFGPIQSFTTAPIAPTATTGAASNRTGTSATLNGTSNPGGAATVGWFRYSTVSPGAANDTFGTRVPAVTNLVVGSGTSTAVFSQAATGLTPGTTYFYCAITSNSVGRTFGTLQSFFTPLPPTAATSNATAVASTSATLNGAGSPNGATTIGWFRYSTSNPGVASDSAGLRVPASGGSALGVGTNLVTYSQNVTGLSPATTYYFWSITQSAEGTAFGIIRSFTTP